MSKKSVAVGSVVAGVLGLGVGAAAGGSDAEPTEATPETVTAPAETPETETVTEEVTAPAETPETETVTEEVEVVKEVTPQACIEALDIGSQGFTLAAKNSTQSARVIPLIQDALQAGLTSDIAAVEEITATLQDINGKIVDINDDLGETANRMTLVAQECRSKAE